MIKNTKGETALQASESSSLSAVHEQVAELIADHLAGADNESKEEL